MMNVQGVYFVSVFGAAKVDKDTKCINIIFLKKVVDIIPFF